LVRARIHRARRPLQSYSGHRSLAFIP
jgi:hypothetical protein